MIEIRKILQKLHMANGNTEIYFNGYNTDNYGRSTFYSNHVSASRVGYRLSLKYLSYDYNKVTSITYFDGLSSYHIQYNEFDKEYTLRTVKLAL